MLTHWSYVFLVLTHRCCISQGRPPPYPHPSPHHTYLVLCLGAFQALIWLSLLSDNSMTSGISGTQTLKNRNLVCRPYLAITLTLGEPFTSEPSRKTRLHCSDTCDGKCEYFYQLGHTSLTPVMENRINHENIFQFCHTALMPIMDAIITQSYLIWHFIQHCNDWARK